MKTILDYIEIGKKEGRLITGGERATDAGDGYFIQPTVIADVAPTATLAQEEIFGPVLAVIKANDFDDALAIANNTEYGLTGAVYTSSARARSSAPSASSTSATCTSIASAPARWSARIPSAASICRAPTPRPAARIISTCSRKRNRLGKRSFNDQSFGAQPRFFPAAERQCAPDRRLRIDEVFAGGQSRQASGFRTALKARIGTVANQIIQSPNIIRELNDPTRFYATSTGE